MSDENSPPASPPEPPVFRLGLTLAGAVSAGAYSAGVLDFLREALDAWERAKANGKDSSGNLVPQHKVQIKAISGTSAGAMCAAMFVGTLRKQPVADPSPLYTAWVDQIDIDPMLDDADLLAGNGVKSLLNCRILDDIAQQILPSNNSAFGLPPWVAENTEIFLCTTSLRGIPYNINAYQGGDSPYGMALHAGVMKYRLISTGTDPSQPIDAIPLAANAPPSNWDNLRDAALASGAFPLALQARITNTPLDTILNRRWEVPDDKAGRRTQYQYEMTPAISGPSVRFTALCVDGGAINNEPVEHVRLALSLPESPLPGCTIKRLDRDLKKANAATILIDPFPDAQTFKEKYEPRLDLWSVIKGLVPAMMNQLRFKADELILAESVGVGSRYLISPKRQIPAGGQEEQANLACGALGGFLGFIDRAFRHHDYQLGRLNCQRFLARYFYMDMQSEGLGDNRKLFANTPDAYKGAAYFDGDLPAIVAEQLAAKPPNPDILPVPVIPLMPELRGIKAAIGSDNLDWPKYDRKRLDGLERRIRNRLDGLLTRIMDFLKIPVRRWLLSGFATLLRVNPAVRAAGSIRKAIEKALDTAGL